MCELLQSIIFLIEVPLNSIIRANSYWPCLPLIHDSYSSFSWISVFSTSTIYVQVPCLNLGRKTDILVKLLVIYLGFYFQKGCEDFHLFPNASFMFILPSNKIHSLQLRSTVSYKPVIRRQLRLCSFWLKIHLKSCVRKFRVLCEDWCYIIIWENISKKDKKKRISVNS